MKQMLIVRTPSALPRVWVFVRPFVTQATRRKVRVLDDDEEQARAMPRGLP